jgi:hypothetical protein
MMILALVIGWLLLSPVVALAVAAFIAVGRGPRSALDVPAPAPRSVVMSTSTETPGPRLAA